MGINKTASRDSKVFSHSVRTLSLDEVERVAGGDGHTGPTFGTKNMSAQDNQVKAMS